MHHPYGDSSQGQDQPPQYGQAPSQALVPQYLPGQGPGYVSYGEGAAPPYIYVPAPGLVQPSELGALEDDAQLWLLVTVAGFWVCLGWITGPLGWYYGAKIRRRYRELGHHPCASANWAWGLGIAGTMFFGLAVAFLFVLFV